MNRRVAVVGGAGFIGSHIVERLVAAGTEVMIIDDLSHPCGTAAPASVEFLEANAGSDVARNALATWNPDALIHLAAKGGVNKALRDPGWHIGNVLSNSVACFESAAAAGCKTIVIASSGGAVYGDPRKLPAHEGLTPAPRSAYGAEKLSEETYLWTYASRGVRTVALRFGNVYGPRQDGTGEAGVVAITALKLAGSEAPVIYGDGGQTRDFIYVGDVADATVLALGAPKGALNVGTGVETSVLEVVTTLVDLSGLGLSIDFQPARGGEVRRVCLDPTRTRDRLGFRASTSLRQGLAATAEFFNAIKQPLSTASREG